MLSAAAAFVDADLTGVTVGVVAIVVAEVVVVVDVDDVVAVDVVDVDAVVVVVDSAVFAAATPPSISTTSCRPSELRAHSIIENNNKTISNIKLPNRYMSPTTVLNWQRDTMRYSDSNILAQTDRDFLKLMLRTKKKPSNCNTLSSEMSSAFHHCMQL